MAEQSLLAIIIITYNRPADLLDLLRSISTQQHLNLLKEIVVVNNCSTISYEAVTEYLKENPTLPIQYKMAPANLGVAKGRNYAIQFASAPLLFLIDDDAVFADDQALKNICSSFRQQQPAIGIVSFLVKYYSNSQIQQNVFPHKQFSKHKDLPRFPTSYFVGCAHAVQANALKSCGGYPTDFFYGMEEYDLSYRLLDAGYSIWYESSVVVLHKESPQGRRPRLEVLQHMWVNKSIVAWRYLPLLYFLSTSALWNFHYLYKSKCHLPGWWQGLKMVCCIPKKQTRKPISRQTLNYLRQVKARLWY
jgi:GT2 family glycosyltransferase